MEELLNPNFIFLRDDYPSLYDKCKEMDLAIVNEKYNDSVVLSESILDELLKILVKYDNNNNLDELIERVCKLNSTATEIGLFLKEIRTNSQKASNNPKRFSKSKAITNAEMVYEVTSYFLYVGENPLEPYSPPHYYDEWVKNEIANISNREEYECNTHKEEKKENPQKLLEDFSEKTEESSKKIAIEIKTEKTPVIRVIMREDMVDKFKPVIDIDYVDD